MEYLWQHRIDILQDAVIEAAIIHWRKKTGARVNRYTMLKLIIMKYGEGLDKEIEGYPLRYAPLGGRNSGQTGGKRG